MKVFTTGQVAKICKVAPRTVSKWFDSGRLKGYRIPGSQDRRIPREYLIRFLKEHGMPLGDLEDEAMAKVLIVAHLFGCRLQFDHLVDAAHEAGLIVVEDCAQAFNGRGYPGHPKSDVVMFSFGPLKNATALGGALVRVHFDA